MGNTVSTGLNLTGELVRAGIPLAMAAIHGRVARTDILIADTGDSRFVFDKTGSKSAEIITLPNNSAGRAQEGLSWSRGVDPHVVVRSLRLAGRLHLM